MPPPRHRRTPSTPGRGRLAPALLCLLILAPGCALAQSPQPAQPSDGSTNSSSSDSNNNGNYFNPNFNPSMAIVIVVLITAFFFLGFSSIFIRNCAERDEEGSAGRGGGAGRAAGARSRRQQGLKPEVLESFPALVYSEVKEHKIGKGALECAVCLSEFEDDETLRLLPGCNHVFHVECIDAWLSSHVTCPVCRSNLVDAASQQPADAGSSDVPANDAGREVPVAVPSPPPEHVAVVIDRADEEADEEQQQKEEAMELAELGSQQRESRTRSGRQPTKFPRSHSTGHSLAPRQPAAAAEPCECGDRYTLRLPDHVMKEIFAARKFHRSASCVAFPAEGEGSSRPGYRAGGEGSSRGGRSARGFGRSDRWPSFFVRTLSAKFPAWRRGGGGGGDGDGSVKKGNGEGSTTRGRFAAVMTPFECLNGGSGAAAAASDGAKAEGAAASVEPESKSDAVTRGV